MIKKLTLNDSGSYRCGPAGPENDVLNITIKSKYSFYLKAVVEQTEGFS